MISKCRICGHDFEQDLPPRWRLCLTCMIVLFMKTYPSNMMTKARAEKVRLAKARTEIAKAAVV